MVTILGGQQFEFVRQIPDGDDAETRSIIAQHCITVQDDEIALLVKHNFGY